MRPPKGGFLTLITLLAIIRCKSTTFFLFIQIFLTKDLLILKKSSNFAANFSFGYCVHIPETRIFYINYETAKDYKVYHQPRERLARQVPSRDW